jgi:hypothetical protein
MAGTKKIVTSLGHSYKINKRRPVSDIIKDRHDYILDLCCSNPNLFYIDCDIELFAFPKIIENGLPYFKKHPSGTPDEMMLYVNGCTDFFKSLYPEKKQRNLEDIRWWFRKIIRVKKVNYFDSDCYDSSYVVERDEALLASYGIERYMKKVENNG